jgi:hypothetical protein
MDMVGAIESPKTSCYIGTIIPMLKKGHVLTASEVDPPDTVMRAQVRRIRVAKLRTEGEGCKALVHRRRVSGFYKQPQIVWPEVKDYTAAVTL